MRFGVFTGMGNTSWDAVRDLWRHLADSGWHAACVTDHFMPNTPERVGDVMEAWTTLGALAALTPRLRVGTIVSGNTYRHPAVLAKMAAQVDIVSGGRLICGIGAAWQENEHEAYGIPFYSVGERLARLDEACHVLKALWTQDKSTFKGRYYTLHDAPLSPKPVQRPYPELMIGGGGEKVTLKIAARHADHWNVWGGPDTLARKNAILDEHCRAAGRDPRNVARSANMALAFTDSADEAARVRDALSKRFGMADALARDTALTGSSAEIRDKVGRLAAAGVDMLWIPSMFLPKDPRPVLDRFMKDIAPAFR
jgi:F420-dependent oxidoreductase-like protein